MIHRIVAIASCLLIFENRVRADDDLPDLDATAFGVNVVAVSDTKDVFKEEKIELPTKIGVILVHVEPHGPAANAKLNPMDVITNVNKKAIRTAEEFNTAVKSLTVGKEYEVSGYRALEVRGKVTWKKGTVKITPVTVRDVFIGALRKKTDEVRDSTSYTHLDTTEFVNSRSEFYCYFVSAKSAKPTLRLQIQYVADDWLFIRRFTIKADDTSFTISPTGIRDVNRDNSGGKIWEWHNRPVGEKERELLDAIVKANRVILRCEGDQYQKDRDLSKDEIHRIKTILTAYRIMGGE